MAHDSHRRGAKRRAGRSETSENGKPPSQRQLRVGELVRHGIAEILTQGTFRDPALDGRAITVPEVRMSPDLRNATVFVMPLGGIGEDEIVDALMRNRKYIRGQLAKKMSQKFVPALTFTKDKSFDTYGRIDELLRSPEVAPDLTHHADDPVSDKDAETF